MLRLHKLRALKSPISMLNNRTNGPTTELGMPKKGMVYKIASSKGLIPNPESKAIGTKLEEYCDFHQAIKPKGTSLMCVELSEEWSRIS